MNNLCTMNVCRDAWSAAVFTIFFFQAEDGIRDLTVTGVQTCALPIYPAARRAAQCPAAACHRPAGVVRRTGQSGARAGLARGLHGLAPGVPRAADRQQDRKSVV